MKNNEHDSVNKILLISNSCVGDAIMTTPVMQALHQLYPDAVMDIVGDKRSSILFSLCPYRGEIFHKIKTKPFRGVFDLLKKLRRHKYDVIVDLRTDALSYLLHGTKKYTKLRAQAYGPHAVEQHLGIIRRIHGDRPLPGTCAWFGDEHEKFADQAVTELPGERWLALAPGSAETKRWPSNNYIELANSLTDVFTGVMLIASESERIFTTVVGSQLTLPYIDMAGTDLLQAAALLKRASYFVGSDSGLGHVASGVSTPTLTLFSTDHPSRCLPWGNEAAWLIGDNKNAANISARDAESKIRQWAENSGDRPAD